MTTPESIDARRRTLRPWPLAAILLAILAVVSLTNVARAADISSSVAYPPSGATVGTSVPVSNSIATFSPGTALAAGEKIAMTFPVGTTLAASSIVVGDFLIVQSATGTSTAGAATAPSAVAVDAVARTITLTIATASLSTVGDSAGLGTVTVATSTTGVSRIKHPTTATITGTFQVATMTAGDIAKDSGSISDVVFVAGPYDFGSSSVATSTASVEYGSMTTVALTARDRYDNPILDLVVGNVSFALSGGTSAGSFAVATNGGSGHYYADFTPTAVGTASTLTATYNAGTNARLGGSPTITVTPKPLTVASGVTIDNKVYDKTNAATLAFNTPVLSGVESGGVVSVNPATGSATFASVNVGTGIAVTVTGLALQGTDAGNYTLTQPAALTANITARALTVTAGTQTRVYDGTTASSGTPTVTAGSLASTDTIAAIAQTFDTENVGTNKVLTPAGVVTDGNAGNNYDLTLATVATGEITQRALTVTAVTQTRAYDGTTASSGTPTVTAGTLATGDTIAAITQTFDNRNVGTNKVLTPAGVVTDGNAGDNYALTLATVATGEITTRAITVTASTQARVYDGTTASSGTPTVTSGSLVGGDTIAAITQTFDTRNVGTNKVITPAGVVTDGNGGNNYAPTLTTVSTGQITPKALTAPGVTAANKVYDKTNTATLNLGTPGLTAIELTDDVTVNPAGYTATFASVNVGTSIAVTVTGLALQGDDAGNYTLTQPSPTADITAATLTVTGVTASNKVYNADTTATLNTGSAAFVGLLGGDSVKVSAFGASGTFGDKIVGTGKTVTVTGITAAGTDGANYTVTQPTTTADITAATLTVTGVTASNKVYNANTTATLNTGSAAFVGVLGGETVTVGGTATGTFADKNVGTSKTVTVTGITAAGTDGANYTVTQPTTTADITARALTVTGVTASDKVHDGNTTATLLTGSASLAGVLNGDTVTLDVSGAVGTFADANVGTGKTVTVTGITHGGTDAANYTLTQPSTTANITAVAQTPASDPAPAPTPTPTLFGPTAEPVVTRTNEDSTLVTAGQPTSAETQSSSGGTAEVTVPANALSAGATLTAASIDNLEDLAAQAPPPADAQLVLAFVIEATDAQGNALTEDFAQPVELEFNVPADSLPAGATAGEIVLAVWNGTSWTEVQGTVLFNADGTVTISASVDHFTIFSVQHQPGRGSFSPAPAFPVSFTVWGGGGYDLLDTAVGAGGSAWVMVDGRFHGYNVGAPAFVNAGFRAMLPAGIASNTAVVVSRPELLPMR